MADLPPAITDILATARKCDRCNNNRGETPHTCPHELEINGNDKYTCNCCNDCWDNCEKDI